MMRPDWDQYFMTIAYLAASRSQDSSTHAGAVIVRPDNTIVSTGYNSPPRGVDIKHVPTERPDKYYWMEHAERNAIYAAAKNEGGIDGCRLYVNFLPCADCARAIIQTGISEVIVHWEGQQAFNQASGAGSADWHDSHRTTFAMIGDGEIRWSGGKLRWYKGNLWMPKGYFRGQEFDL